MNKAHSCLQPNSTIFSLWVITRAHPGRSRIQWKKKKKKKIKDSCGNDTMLTVPKPAGLATQAPRMENIQQSQQLPGPCSTVMKIRGISWQGPISDLLRWEQLRLRFLIPSRFHFPEPDTLYSTRSLLRKVLKDTLQGEQHQVGFGLRLFQAKLAVKGLKNLHKSSNTTWRKMIV